MKLAFLPCLLALAAAACGPDPKAEEAARAEAARQAYQKLLHDTQEKMAADRARSLALLTPNLTPAAITSELAQTDSACERRDHLPRAKPFPEADAIAATGRAKIDGDKLIVGRFSFDAMKDGETGAMYVGRYDGMPIDVVLSYDGESGGWTIADQESKDMLETGFLPIPSPDGKSWAVNLAFPAPDGAVEIYERGAKAWVKLASFPIEDACDVRWLDNDTFVFRDNTGYPFHKGLGPDRSIRRKDGAWVIDPPAPGQPPPNAPDAYPSGGFGAVR